MKSGIVAVRIPSDRQVDRSREVPSSLNCSEPVPEPRAVAIAVEVLVICTANQCRSPMAAAIISREFERRGVRARIHSAGVNAIADVTATRDAIAVMKDQGLDISEHRSRPLEAADLNGADIVVTM